MTSATEPPDQPDLDHIEQLPIDANNHIDVAHAAAAIAKDNANDAFTTVLRCPAAPPASPTSTPFS